MKRAAEQMKVAAEQMKDHAWGLVPAGGWKRDMALMKDAFGATAWNMDFGLAMAQPFDEKHGRSPDAETDRYYERGQRALDRQRWDEARESFSEAAARGGSRTDGALYWKAYAENKLGRRDEAQATLEKLRKAHPGTSWLDAAKRPEVEVRQA